MSIPIPVPMIVNYVTDTRLDDTNKTLSVGCYKRFHYDSVMIYSAPNISIIVIYSLH